VRPSPGWRCLRMLAVVVERLSSDMLHGSRRVGQLLDVVHLVMLLLWRRRFGWGRRRASAQQVVDIHPTNLVGTCLSRLR
jgi:hypothetical protein